MKLETLYKIAKGTNDLIGNVKSEVTFYLTQGEYEHLQQEVYEYQNKTIQGYKSEKIFQIVLFNTKYIFKSL